MGIGDNYFTSVKYHNITEDTTIELAWGDENIHVFRGDATGGVVTLYLPAQNEKNAWGEVEIINDQTASKAVNITSRNANLLTTKVNTAVARNKSATCKYIPQRFAGGVYEQKDQVTDQPGSWIVVLSA